MAQNPNKIILNGNEYETNAEVLGRILGVSLFNLNKLPDKTEVEKHAIELIKNIRFDNKTLGVL